MVSIDPLSSRVRFMWVLEGFPASSYLVKYD